MKDGNLRQLFRSHLPEVFWISVETGATGRGIPDSHGLSHGHSCWIEFKQTKGWKTSLSPEQIAWHLRYARNGGHSWIAIRKRNRVSDELWLMPGGDAERCVSLREINADCEIVFRGGPAKWDWDAIRHNLFPS